MLVSYCYNIKDKFCLTISDSYLKKNKSYGCVKNGVLYSDNAKIISTHKTICLILHNSHETLSSTESVWQLFENTSRLFLRLFEFKVSTLG